MKYSHSKPDCCMCNILAGRGRFGDVDNILWQSENYFAVASIGAFIPGWTLIVPKKHQLNLKLNYTDEELLDFTRFVQSKINGSFGNSICFEHGSVSSGSSVGCGVDHAHLHIVPFAGSLSNAIISFNPELVWNVIEPKKLNVEIRDDSEYLLYFDNLDKPWYVTKPEHGVSQFFRKVLAAHLSFDDASDYKTNHHLLSSLLTFRVLNNNSSHKLIKTE